MSTLVLRLAGPMQSWGMKGRFIRRTTELQPTKSGVVGFLAAALGRRRTDPIEDLAQLRMGVRVEQPGTLMRDFQTAAQDGKTAPLSYRYFLSDAVFLAAVEGPGDFVSVVEDAINSPVFPLYLGRRAFPPAGRIGMGIRAGSLVDVLHEIPWTASQPVMEDNPHRVVRLRVVRDADAGETATTTLDDNPLSFDPDRRLFGSRPVVEESVDIANPCGRTDPSSDHHDPFAFLGGQIVP